MIYLSGAITQTMLANPRPDLGIMFQPGMKNDTGPFQFWTFGMDNGRVMIVDGKPVTKPNWDAGNWLEWGASMRRHRTNSLFMVAPDVVGDAEATWAMSEPYLPTIRQLGFKAALVAQDGMESMQIDWDSFDVLFVGGNDPWKFSELAFSIATEARRRGKWTHMGRVNSLARLRMVTAAMFDSADGTYVKYGPDQNLPDVYEWLDVIAGGQTSIFGVEAA